MKYAALSLPILALLVYPASDAVAQDSVIDAIKNGTPYINLRYRFEHVDQDGFTEYARASTLRTRLGFKTKTYQGFSALLEGENITIIGNQLYNDTVNGRTQFPTVADPEITELNQVYINYDSVLDTNIRVGRQRILLDNQRFVGAVGFRQNEQTFDAVFLTNKSFADTTAKYIYIKNVNRIFGAEAQLGDFQSNSHLVNIKYDGLGFGSLVGYGYLLKFGNSAANSSQTYGVRFSGKQKLSAIEGVSLLYAVETAFQTDYANNTADFDVNYYLIEPGVAYSGLSVKLGYEVLDGDGTSSFRTPLATLHAFNGITDKFLTTPANGIEDLYVKVKYKVGDLGYLKAITVGGAYHKIESENNSDELGEEWSAKVGFKVTKNVSLSLQHADYRAQTVSTDTTKTWATLQVKF